MPVRSRHRIVLIPGMFGFGRLAGYDYFEHVERELRWRFSQAGLEATVEVAPTPPTASIRRRACVLAETVHAASGPGDDAAVHLVGHSTGGLDARLLTSPSVSLPVPAAHLAWRERVRTVVTINTPHYGTPLAGFFATVSGTRLLYALSLLTFTTLRYGGPPLTVLSNLVAALADLDERLGLDIHVLDRVTELFLRFIGPAGRDEVHRWLDGIRGDQGGVIQISPEAMDLFNATTENADEVRYGYVATSARPPGPMSFARSLRSPNAALTHTIYTTLYAFAARVHRTYPYPEPDAAERARFGAALGGEVLPGHSDGVVPTLSQRWGTPLWIGSADHLDVVGHFRDDGRPTRHVDWLTSGSGMTRRAFGEAMDAIATFALA